MNADVTQIRNVLIGIWVLDSGGMLAQVTLAPDGYSNMLSGGTHWHSGTWAVINNGLGGQTIVFTLKDWYPKETIGPLRNVPIMMPATVSWNVTNVQTDQILIQGGAMRRITPEVAASGTWMNAVPQSTGGFPGMMTADVNSEIGKELGQIADAGRKVWGGLTKIFKKR